MLDGSFLLGITKHYSVISLELLPENPESRTAMAAEFRGLGVFITTDCTLSAQVIAAANKARRVLFWMKRTFLHLPAKVFLPLYCSNVRPHLEYASPSTIPYLRRDIDHLERVQRLATNMVLGLRGRPYYETLRALKLHSIEGSEST